MRPYTRLALTLLLGLVCLAPAASARADTSVAPSQTVWPLPNVPPPGYRITSRQAELIAVDSPLGHKLQAEHPGIPVRVFVQGIHDGVGFWEVDFEGRKIPLGEVDVNGDTGSIVGSWSGWHAATPQTRGHIAHAADSWWVWLPLCLLFVAPFFDFRRPLRLLHLDLFVLLSFGISHLFFNQGLIFASVPLVYPVLVYLLVRMLWVGFGPRAPRPRLVPHVPLRWLVIGLVALIAFRIAVNVVANHVIDVGYAGVVGADRIEHRLPLYVDNNAHGDTYGPINYLAYVPFELAFPWHGAWDSLPAAHAAAIFFDLLTLGTLFWAGTRLRAGPEGRRLGLVLAYAWTAYPYTLYALANNTNDALVSALLVLAFVALRSPVGRGTWLGLAAAAKFAPLVLAPLFAAGRGERRPRGPISFGFAAAGVIGVSLAVYVRRSSFHDFWASTIAYQLHRISPFSVWTLYPSLHWLQLALAAAAGILALAVAFAPRRRDAAQVAALAAAVLIASQLPAGHWFYFYVVWFAPFVLIALFATHAVSEPRPAGSPAHAARPRSGAREASHTRPPAHPVAPAAAARAGVGRTGASSARPPA